MFEKSYVIQVFNDFLDLLHRFYKLYQRNFVRKQITPLEEEASAYPTLRKADVLDMKPQEIAQRKFYMVVKATNPDRVTIAFGGLYQGLLGVLMTVKFQFAQTVALAVSLANNCRRPLAYVLTPILASASIEVPPEWINAIVNYIAKTLALMFAWTIQRAIVAFQSAVQVSMSRCRCGS